MPSPLHSGLRRNNGGHGFRRRYAAHSTVTGVPARTLRNAVGSPRSVPKRFTGLAGRISPGLLIGVRPKKMQNARPGGQ